MRQTFERLEISDLSFSNRGLEKKIVKQTNARIQEINAEGGVVIKYEILNSERWGKDISVILLVNWE